MTQQVTEVPTGPDGRKVRALVTNDGVVSAEGGTVLLSAAAADGLVQTLVRAGGHVSAGSGTVALHGIGGDVVVAGEVSATGHAPGSSGGSVEVLSDHAVRLTKTARIDASGPAGGGTIAIGTTLARAKGGPGVVATLTAARATIAAGARVTANATANGNGGRVVVLSSGATAQHGSIAARGGPAGGTGGFVEVSGTTGFVLDGPIDVGAATPAAIGSILLDPTNLTVVAGAVPTGPDTIAAGFLDSLIGAVALEASNDLRVSASFATQGDLALIAGHLLTVDVGVTVSGGGNVILFGGGDIAHWGGSYPAGVGGVVVNGTVQAAHQLGVFGGTLGVTVAGTLLAPELVQLYAGGAGNITLAAGSVVAGGGTPGAYVPTSVLETSTTGGDVTQDAAGLIAATSLRSEYGVQGSVSLAGTGNRIATIDGTSGNGLLVGGDFSLTDASSLTVVGTLQAGPSFVTAGVMLPGQDYINITATTQGGGVPLGCYSFCGPNPPVFIAGPTGGQLMTSALTLGPAAEAPPTAAHRISLAVTGRHRDWGRRRRRDDGRRHRRPDSVRCDHRDRRQCHPRQHIFRQLGRQHHADRQWQPGREPGRLHVGRRFRPAQFRTERPRPGRADPHHRAVADPHRRAIADISSAISRFTDISHATAEPHRRAAADTSRATADTSRQHH